MKTHKSVFAEDTDHFAIKSALHFNPEPTQTSAVYFPLDMTLHTMSRHGVIKSFTLNLDDFFSTNFTNSYLRLNNAFWGHRDAVVASKRHPNLPYVASISLAGEVFVFNLLSPQVINHLLGVLESFADR